MTATFNWAELALGVLGEWRSGATPSKANPAYWTDGDVPWISPKTMKRKVITGSEEAVTQRAVEDGVATIVPGGSLLIVVRSGILRHSVPVAVTQVECAINQDLRALLPHKAVDPYFVAAQLRWRANELLSVARKVGVTVDSLDFGRLLSFAIRLPSTDEQRRISSRLDELDEQIRGTETALSVASDAIQTIRSGAAGRLLLPRHAPSALLSKEALVRVDDMVAEPVRTGLSVRGNPEPPGVPSIRLSAMARPHVDMSDVRYLPVPSEQVEHLILEKGDILISRGSGTRGFVGRASLVVQGDGQTIFPDKAFRIRLTADKVIPEWFLAVWNSAPIRARLQQRARTTAGIWMIQATEIVSTALPIPSLQQQESDLERLAVIDSQLDGVTRKITRAKRLLEKTQGVLYSEAFSGQLVFADTTAEAGRELAIQITKDGEMPKAVKPKRARPKTTKERFDELVDSWPPAGQSFGELSGKLLAPYDELKDVVFGYLESGKLKQQYDAKAGHMMLVFEK
jgi:type I restriction enzyme S subunit